MPNQNIFGVDGSESTFQALQNLGSLLEPAGVQFHLFYAAPERSLFDPGGLSTLSGEPDQWKEAQEGQAHGIIELAAGLLSDIGFKRSRI
jgi:hypothetical protein